MKQIIMRMTYSKKYLEDQPINGYIHSVYNKTINLLFQNQLLALQAKDSPLSPISLISNLSPLELNNIQCKPGMSVQIKDNVLSISDASTDLSFDCSNSALYESKLQPCSQVDAELLFTALSQTSKNGWNRIFLPPKQSDSDSAFMILSAAKERISHCSFLFENGDYALAAGNLSKLIGLGIGLTPSGDDFLCGVLAGFIFMNQQNHPFFLNLCKHISQHLEDTNPISSAFLSCALSRHFSEPIIKLSKKSTPRAILDDFEQIGHSSGVDTLSGIYYALSFHL